MEALTFVERCAVVGCEMDRTDILSRLERAEECVARGDRALETQRRAIEKLREIGSDTTAAETELREFEKAQAAFIADRNALLEQLARGG